MDTNLRQKLAEHLHELLKSDGRHLPAYTELLECVVNGAVHCETHGLKWKEAALSYRHVAEGESLGTILTKSVSDRWSPDHKNIRTALKIPTDMRESDLGLPLDIERNVGTSHAMRYLWIRSALFMIEWGYEYRLECWRYSFATST